MRVAVYYGNELISSLLSLRGAEIPRFRFGTGSAISAGAKRLPRSRLPSLGGQVARNDKKERRAMTKEISKQPSLLSLDGRGLRACPEVFEG